MHDTDEQFLYFLVLHLNRNWMRFWFRYVVRINPSYYENTTIKQDFYIQDIDSVTL